MASRGRLDRFGGFRRHARRRQGKGFLQCGVNTGLAGFAAPDDKGEWSGFDVDYCRAIAAAIFGDPTKVNFTPTTAKDRFTALQSGEIDVLSRNTTWTISRDTTLGFNFAGVNYYDGQGFMSRQEVARRQLGAAAFRRHGLRADRHDHRAQPRRLLQGEQHGVQPGRLREARGGERAYDSGRCDVYTTDQSGLYAIRLTLTAPDDHVVLPEIISKEPLGPAVRQGDDQWFDIVKWTHYALLTAEELGVTQANVDEMKASENPEIKRVLGGSRHQDRHRPRPDKTGSSRSSRPSATTARSSSATSAPARPLKIARGVNALWSKGGLQYAPPIR